MLLAIDVGNTNIVFGLFSVSREILRTWRISTHPLATADEIRIKIASLLKLDLGYDTEINQVIISSVVPPLTQTLRHAFQNVKALRVIDSRSPFSFEIDAKPADQVGADRLVNAEAVVRNYGAPAIIVDSGTATTICALSLDDKGKAHYLGGAIMPGIELSIQTLARHAAKLFTVELIAPEKPIGQNTEEALRSGILLGYASMIDGMVRRFKKELAPSSDSFGEIKVIATGGVSELLKGLATELTHFDSHLTLKGMAYLYESYSSR